MKAPRSLLALATETLASSPLAQKLKEAEIWNIWPEVVGSAIASKTRPVRIIDGKLTVEVNSTPWLQELNFLKEEIRNKLNRQLPEPLIKELILKSGRPKRQTEPTETPEPLIREITRAEQHNILNSVATITDPELRAELRKLMEQHYRRS